MRVFLCVALASSGCIDFGYEVSLLAGDTGPVGSGGGGGTGGGGGCVEEPTDPTTDGPQIALITLNVDQPVVVINAGDVVTWTNNDSMVHTVTAGAPGVIIPEASGGFDSGDLGAGAQWAFRFCSVRTAVYFCTTHPAQMNGYQVIVE